MSFESTYENKNIKMIAIGDSITYGAYCKRANDPTAGVAKPNYAEQVAEMLGVTDFTNYSIPGICISSLVGEEEILDLCLAKRCELLQGGDLILISMGTNDFGCATPIGTNKDTEDVSLYGALDISFRTIKANNPNAQVYVILPIERSDITVNKLGLKLDDYRNVIEEKAMEYSFNVIDGRKLEINHRNPIEKREYIFDGIHPMPAGHYLYARLVYNAIIGEETYGITTDKILEVVNEGEQTRISARIASRLPKKSVIWESSDKNVATVKNGVVTAVAPGTAVITAKACTGETVPFICVVEPI